jgi:sodium/potassium-transporting ATPase subunit alpha
MWASKALALSTKRSKSCIHRELWIFTKIVSAYALTLFIISIIVTAQLRKKHPGFETVTGAIIISIGCITACVPQVMLFDRQHLMYAHGFFKGLPICVALSLSIIARRMAKRNVLVKNLGTIETLGCMSVLCSDKTGTLTVGKMVAHHYRLINFN